MIFHSASRAALYLASRAALPASRILALPPPGSRTCHRCEPRTRLSGTRRCRRAHSPCSRADGLSETIFAAPTHSTRSPVTPVAKISVERLPGCVHFGDGHSFSSSRSISLVRSQQPLRSMSPNSVGSVPLPARMTIGHEHHQVGVCAKSVFAQNPSCTSSRYSIPSCSARYILSSDVCVDF